MAAGDGEGRPGGDDARAGDEPGVDVLAEIDGEKGGGADVAHGGEAGLERGAGVADAEDGVVTVGVVEVVNGIVAIGAAGEMGVAVDEAGKDEVVGEIDDGGTGGDGEGGVFDRADAVAFEDKRDVLTVVAGVAVEEVAGFDVGEGGRGGERAERGGGDQEREGSEERTRHGAPCWILRSRRDQTAGFMC